MPGNLCYCSVRGSHFPAVLSAAPAISLGRVEWFCSRSEELSWLEPLPGVGCITFQAVFSQHCSLLLHALCHAGSFPQPGVFLPSTQSLFCGCCGLIQLVVAPNTQIFLGYLLCTNLSIEETEGRWEWLMKRIGPLVLLQIKSSSKIKDNRQIRSFQDGSLFLNPLKKKYSGYSIFYWLCKTITWRWKWYPFI